MSDLALHNRNVANAAPAGFTPRAGDVVAAKWSEDNQWYRAKVKKSSAIKKEATVYLMDYGNEETMPFSRIRPLDTKFKSLPGQAREARLSFVKLPPKDSEYGPDARRRFAHFTEGRKLVANIDQREGNLLHLRLIDPSDPNAVDDPLACINADLVRDGEFRNVCRKTDMQVSQRSTRAAATFRRIPRSSRRSTRRPRERRLTVWVSSSSETLARTKCAQRGCEK